MSIKDPRDVAILVPDGLSARPEYLAGALCASIKGEGPLPEGPVLITVGEAAEDGGQDRFSCE